MRRLNLDSETLVDSDEIVLAVTSDEVNQLVSAIGGALQRIDEWEFHTMLGYTREEANTLIRQLDSSLEDD